MASTRLTIFSLVVAVAALVLVIELLRRRRLREKYSVIWIVVSLGIVVIAVFPDFLVGTANLLGVQVPSNLLFLLSLLTLFAVSLQLSGEVGLLEEQTRTLAEEIGALRLRLDNIEHDHSPSDEGDRRATGSAGP